MRLYSPDRSNGSWKLHPPSRPDWKIPIMNDNSTLRSHLELCSRLGVRYVSVNAGEIPPVLENDAILPEGSRQVKPAPTATPQESVPPQAGIPKWLTGSAETVQAMELKAFERDIHECPNCALGKTRKNFVFGSGNPKAEVLFVGEAPGADEDEQGLPFVGKAGQLLTKIIESTKTWKREDVFICNVLKCRPPGNRTPLPEEVDQCRPYLEEQIRIIKPKLIL